MEEWTMKWPAIVSTSLLIGFSYPTAAYANGATASFPAGGVVFQHEKNISIVREELEVGLRRIHVHYVFRSSADRPLARTIGFPMAKVLFDDGPDNLGDRSASETNLRNYMAFEAKANGKPVRSKLHEYAWKDGMNVTAQLRAMKVPVFATYNGKDFGLQDLPRQTIDKLLKSGLADRYVSDRVIYPRWQYQTVYEWRQTFPPGKSELDISYTPLYGDETTEAKYSMFPGKEGDAAYCYDDEFKARFEERRKNGVYTEPLTLGYILKTATNWNGSIGVFRLKISNPDHYLFSFCPPDGLKPAGNGSIWEARNFVPRSDLDLIFMSQDADQ
jgi:hypothetical protein